MDLTNTQFVDFMIYGIVAIFMVVVISVAICFGIAWFKYKKTLRRW